MASLSSLDMNAIFKLSDINKQTQAHLAKVYAALGSGVILSLISGIITSYGIIGIVTWYLILFASIIGELMTLFSKSNGTTKLKAATFYLWATTFGSLVGLIVQNTQGEDRKEIIQIAMNAFIFTVAIFCSFTMFALVTVRREVIFMYSLILCLVLSLINIFVYSFVLYAIIGIFIGVLYVIIDTQIIIHKTEFGIFDVFSDAKQLLIDMFKIFIEIMKIFGKEKSKKD